MTHLLDDNHTNGRIHHLQPLHTHETFTTTLRLPREHPARVVAPVQHTVVLDSMSPAIFVCAVIVGLAMSTGLVFAAWKAGEWLFGIARHLIGG